MIAHFFRVRRRMREAFFKMRDHLADWRFATEDDKIWFI